MKNKTPEHFLGKISIKILLRNPKNEILVTRDPSDKAFELPGGRLDLGENVEETIKRELNEELSLSLKKINLKYVFSGPFVHGRDTSNFILLAFLLDLADSDIKKLKKSTEVDEMVWVSKKNYKKYKYFDIIEEALDTHFKNN